MLSQRYKGKVFNDPIHGHIELEAVDVQVIDTPQFQRLRELKQLGVTYYVYPGATHNRFEHSIGVCHLAGVWIELLQKPELGITAADIKCVRLAGLCHDLGHGPFSHLFDGLFIPACTGNTRWSHEVASQAMLEHIIQENPHIDILPQEDLIHGEPRSVYPQAAKIYLFDIVSNKRNSVDVDKFDYILRDCHNVGMTSPLNPLRLMTFSRVIDNQICFNQKEAYNLYELFHSRYTLFKQVYTHRVSTAIEYMIKDILVSADPYLKISRDIHTMERYTFLNDTILSVIERSETECLKESRRILRRLRSRDLYRFADQTLIPVELFDEIDCTTITSREIYKHCDQESLNEDDIIVQWLTLNYAMKDRNPVDSVKFFTKYDAVKTVSIQKELVSGFIPQQFKEITVRVYSKQSHLTAKIQMGFRKLLASINAHLGSAPLLAESEDTYPSIPSLSEAASKIGKKPIVDYVRNPFISSPNIPSSTASRRTSSLFPQLSPTKRLLEVNDALLIPALNNTKKTKHH
ncbi:SAM domain and HD [Kappamyces sp. JEL0680]|nr:SAM domain and HD [Kappamyces sp. JEL0680]